MSLEMDIKGKILYTYLGKSTKVVIPEGIEEIGLAAFMGHDEIEEIVLPFSLKKIQKFAFGECTGIKKIDIPSQVDRIEYDCFDGCNNLSAINISSGNECYMSLQGMVFSKDLSSLVRVPPAIIIKKYVVPYGIERIEENAFSRCSFLEEIVLPETVTYIGYKAFNYCIGLKKILIPKSIKKVDYAAFANCYSLTNISVSPSNLEYCDVNGMVYTKDYSELIQIPCGIENSIIDICKEVNRIRDRAITSLLKVKDIRLNNQKYVSVNGVIYSSDFEELVAYPAGSTGKNYTVLDETTTICGSAFQNAKHIENIKLGRNIVKISRHAFEGCSIHSVEFNELLSHVGWGSFANCLNLRIVDLSMTQVRYINGIAFFGDLNLEKIILSDKIEMIQRWAFLKCNNLKKIEILGNIACSMHYGMDLMYSRPLERPIPS